MVANRNNIQFRKAVGLILGFFGLSLLFLSVMRGRVSEQDMEARKTLAIGLASRDWKRDISGKIEGGQIEQKNLPPRSLENLRLIHSYSDTFQTYTIFKFQKKGKTALRVQVGDRFYSVRAANRF